MPPTATDPNLGGVQPLWETEGIVFEFHHQPVAKAPRAWDREAKPGVSSYHKGRKVWKRYGLRQQDVNRSAGDPQDSTPAAETSARVVKRRCLVQPPIAPPPSYASKPSQYLPTLRDGVPSTPRRKISQRRSLRVSTSALPHESAKDIAFVKVQGDGEGVPPDQPSDVSEKVQANSVTGPISEYADLRPEGNSHYVPEVTDSSGKLNSSQAERYSTPELSEQCSPVVPMADGGGAQPSENSSYLEPYAVPPEEATPVLATQVNVFSVNEFKTPSLHERSMNFHNTPPGTKQRRSRRQSTPIACKTSSQNQVPTFPIPDQSVVLAANVQDTAISIENQDSALEGSSTKDLVSDDDIATEKLLQGQLEITKAAEQGTETHVKAAEFPCKEAVEEECNVPTPDDPSEDQMSSVKAADWSPPDGQGISAAHRTRSGARFSDDTSMLKDFLNRAQARKAAKSTEPIPAPERADTPRRSPRKILGQLDKNSPSPSKTRDSAHRPGTPPGKALTDVLGCDDAVAPCSEPVIHRRSGRKCPSAKKEAPGAPSFIPVRRPDGADPVVLQKSVAQELAMITRANTRRNKGMSKLPKAMLETLAGKVEEETSATKKQTRSTKSVEWDEKLVYPRENSCSREGREDMTETRPQVRRLRGLGSLNGAPARKATDSKIASNGTPAPKRRGRTKA